MSIYFQAEHHQFREQVRRFFDQAVDAEAWERDGRIPRHIWTQMGELGYLGIALPERYGGTEADFFYAAVFLEELGRTGLGGFAAAVGVQQFMATAHIASHGSPNLKEQYLEPSISGEKVGALAISEPDVGSDVANLRTRAKRDGDHYIINGSKTFITNGVDGDFVTVAARTGDAGQGGISLLVVDQATPGFTAQRLNKMGWHCGDTGELTFDQVRVPVSNRIGDEGQGFYMIMQAFQLERLVAALTAIGGADRALAETHAYIQQRQAFGRPIAKYQVLRHRLTDCMTELAAARHLTYHACWLYDRGETDVAACTMAKLKTSELGKTIADTCLQCFGGYGFMEEYPIARLYRDARAGTIVGGTSEIMHEILGKVLIDGVRYDSKPAANSSSLAELMAAMPQRYRGGETMRVHFDFRSDNSGTFTITLDAQSCTIAPELKGEPDCVVTADGDVYRRIVSGQLESAAAFMQGQIQVSDPTRMQRFLAAFDTSDLGTTQPQAAAQASAKQSTENQAAAESAAEQPSKADPTPVATDLPTDEDQAATRQAEPLPLQGVRILDMTRLYPGPLAAMFLAQLGAEVVKVERPDRGDPMRQYPPFVAGVSAGYTATNRHKRALALDWTAPAGRDVLGALIAKADVVLEGYRPGVLAKAGIDHTWMQQQRADIVLVSLTGYGQTGPYAHQAGHDINYIGYSGLLAQQTAGVLPSVQLADVAGGAYGTVIAVLSALQARQRHGTGAHLDLAMLDATLPLATLQLAHHRGTEDGVPVQGLLTGQLACYRTYHTADSKLVALGALEPKFWQTFCQVLKQPSWVGRQFASGDDQKALIHEVSQTLGCHAHDHLLALFKDHDACLSPVNDLDDVLADPQLRHRHMIKSAEPPQLGNPWWPTQTLNSNAAAPALGQHNQEILREWLDLSTEQIASLQQSGMIAQKTT